MKLFRNIILALSVLIIFTFSSCSKVENVAFGEEIPVSYSVALPDTKSVNADGSAINMVWFALYNMDDATLATNYAPVEFRNGSAHCEVVMMRGHSYKIVFVAQHFKNSSTPTYPIDWKSAVVGLPEAPVANSDQMDLFYGVEEVVNYNGTDTGSIMLDRAVAMMNFICNDTDWTNAVSKPTHSSVTLSGVPKHWNLLSGEFSEQTTELNFAKAEIPAEKHLGAVFCIATGEIAATLKLYNSADDTADPIKTLTIPGVKVERNKKSNIIGTLITE